MYPISCASADNGTNESKIIPVAVTGNFMPEASETASPILRSWGAEYRLQMVALCYQAIPQVCAFHSPEVGILSDIEIYQQ
jgi:hypothetical protein